MQLQVLKMNRTPLIWEENVKNGCFLTMMTLSWIINEIYINILIFVYGWTHNAPMIPKIYNIIGIWSTHQKLLTVKHIATLPYMKWKKRQPGKRKIYDESHISMKVPQ